VASLRSFAHNSSRALPLHLSSTVTSSTSHSTVTSVSAPAAAAPEARQEGEAAAAAGEGEMATEEGAGAAEGGGSYLRPLLRVGQLVRHRSKGYRAVVVGSTPVCAASPGWMLHHRVDGLPHGRQQVGSGCMRTHPPTNRHDSYPKETRAGVLSHSSGHARREAVGRAPCFAQVVSLLASSLLCLLSLSRARACSRGQGEPRTGTPAPVCSHLCVREGEGVVGGPYFPSV